MCLGQGFLEVSFNNEAFDLVKSSGVTQSNCKHRGFSLCGFQQQIFELCVAVASGLRL